MFSYKCHLTRRLTQFSRLINLNDKCLHTTRTVSYSDSVKKSSKKTHPPDEPRQKQFKKISFIEINPHSTPKAANSSSSSNSDRFHSKEQEPENVQHAINDLMKQQESIANKLAKLIDKLEPTKTAEKLLEPAIGVKKNKQSAKEVKVEVKEAPVLTAKTEPKSAIESVQPLSQPLETNGNKFTKQNLEKEAVSSLRQLIEKSKKISSNIQSDSIPEKTPTEQIKSISVIKPPTEEEMKAKRMLKKRLKVEKEIEMANENFFKIQNLKSGSGLQLFTEKQHKHNEITKESTIWSMHYDQELKSAQEAFPVNGFDELITLTNEGKLWRFPIDNEQDIDESEAQIPFHEHVFLDSYLDLFPPIEPVQEFMVLALNGLSQNSYLSLNEKQEIIDWYVKYFEEKKELIKEALDNEKLEFSYKQQK